jgi:AcrR family transcriptional regulator
MLGEVGSRYPLSIMSPKINAPTTREQREWRREQLLDVALELALESPTHEISMTELAKRAGLSRTSVYEYFTSSSDVITQVLIQELDEYQGLLSDAIESESSLEGKLRSWIEASLHYITSGDHLLAKGMGAISTSPESVALFRKKHQSLLAPLLEVFIALGVKNPMRALTFTQAVVDIAVKNIERISVEGPERQEAASREINIAVDLVLTALAALKRA